ncbi:MAG: hypothetical protein L0Y66_16920 [Myxococcaceae bacterium]|nr:hypothetical protein [Myxococcaceae bacterium]MCI0671098.1 hypothetical protein [Myxococcaceae bacterium]
MSTDTDIGAWLAEQGYALDPSRDRARQTLESAGLTRPGKLRMSTAKLDRAREVLTTTFFLHCTNAPCLDRARASNREPLPVADRRTCEACSGSVNRRAESELLEECHRRGIRRLVVVGGSPAVREELTLGLGHALELRMVDGTERRTQDRARHDVAWADLVLVWGASELHHKVSRLYTQAPHEYRSKLVNVARRGVAALLEAALAHLRR